MSNPEFAALEWVGPASAGHGSYTKRFIVFHCTDNDAPAINEANYAKSRSDGIGTHFVCDEKRLIQTCETTEAVGHVGSTIGNQRGIALEMVGTEESSTDHYKEVVATAMPGIKAACTKWGIPPRWLTSAQANDGTSKGWLTHDDCRRFFGGTTHTDPGPNFDRQYVIDKYSETSSAVVSQGDENMSTIVRFEGNSAVWITDGVSARWLTDWSQINGLMDWARSGWFDLKNVTRNPAQANQVVNDLPTSKLGCLGVIVGPKPDDWDTYYQTEWAKVLTAAAAKK
jgi:hypothetical protein